MNSCVGELLANRPGFEPCGPGRVKLVNHIKWQGNQKVWWNVTWILYIIVIFLYLKTIKNKCESHSFISKYHVTDSDENEFILLEKHLDNRLHGKALKKRNILMGTSFLYKITFTFAAKLKCKTCTKGSLLRNKWHCALVRWRENMYKVNF